MLIGAAAISVIVLSRCETGGQRPRTVSITSTREVTRVVDVPKVVTREVDVTREVEVMRVVTREVTKEIDSPRVVTRVVDIINGTPTTPTTTPSPTNTPAPPTATPQPSPPTQSPEAELCDLWRDYGVELTSIATGLLEILVAEVDLIVEAEENPPVIWTQEWQSEVRASLMESDFSARTILRTKAPDQFERQTRPIDTVARSLLERNAAIRNAFDNPEVAEYWEGFVPELRKVTSLAQDIYVAQVEEGVILFQVCGTFDEILQTGPSSTLTPSPTAAPTATSTHIPTPLLSPTPDPNETPTQTATPSPTPEPPSTPTELVERVQNSIVRVKARSGGAIFGRTSVGSGFIFAVEGTTAFVATNHHVIDGSSAVEVEVDSSTYDPLVLGWDSERDVAVLSICCSTEFVALTWASASLSEGETVIAIGYPDNDTGNVIATIGEVRASDDLSMEHGFIPHSAPLNPGNSGGPLFSMPAAEVVGINTARGTESLAFYAVPYQAIEDQAEEWRAQLIVEPAATPFPVVTFDKVEVDGGVYSVHSILDPAPLDPQALQGPDPGKRFVAIDIGVEAIQDGVWPVYGEFKVQDSDGYIYEATLFNNVNVDPIFDSGKLPAGQRVRGWIIFEVPARASLTAVLIDPIGGSGKEVIADLTPN